MKKEFEPITPFWSKREVQLRSFERGLCWGIACGAMLTVAVSWLLIGTPHFCSLLSKFLF